MNYRVAFRQSAEDELATAWLEAADQAAVTRAAYSLEALLKDAPSRWGIFGRGNLYRFETPARVPLHRR